MRRRAHRVRRALRQIGKSARREDVRLAAGLQLQLAFEHIEKTLRRRWTQQSPGRELRGHLREARAQLRRSVDDELHAVGAGQAACG